MDSDKDDAHATSTRPFLITFSGIDGAGKTTQIEHLSSHLQNLGFRVLRLTFWDHVAVWSTMRAGVGQRSVTPLGAKGATQDSFIPRNNKHIRKWYLTATRSGFYVFDVVQLRRLLASRSVQGSDVVIFDRYIYDQIANVYSQSYPARLYARTLLKLTPAPDLAFIIDASPTAAYARKQEYPLEFMHRNRESFLRLREIVPQLITIGEGNEEKVRSEIFFHISRSRLVAGVSRGETTEISVGDCRNPATELL